MLTQAKDLGAILLRRQIVSAAQLAEGRRLAERTGCPLSDALIKLGYVTEAELLQSLGKALNLEFVDLDDVTIPPQVIELIPESVARENTVIPLCHEDGTLMVIMADPLDIELDEKLRFILNKKIVPVLATREQIIAAIDRHYGQTDQECVDEVLCEFTDTAIDFSESQSQCVDVPADLCDLETSDFDLELSEGGAVDAFAATERHATVRYYDRMNPERLFPLMVVISNDVVRDIAKPGVTQSHSKRFNLANDSMVEVEPILPGCDVYPPRLPVTIRGATVSARFHVVPHVLGDLEEARVVLRQGGKVLAEVPLEVRVAKQALTALMGALSFVAPVVSMVFKHAQIDFHTQLGDGMGLFARVGNWLLGWPPELLAVPFLLGTAGLYYWFRPRERNIFWDIDTGGLPGNPGVAATLTRMRSTSGQAALLARAEVLYHQRDYAAALHCYQQGLALGKAEPAVYHRASLAAAETGDSRRAMAILREAESQLDKEQMGGPMWFNMARFATRLGQHPEAIRYLNRAVDAGYRVIDKYRNDSDLMPLRRRGEFREILRSLET